MKHAITHTCLRYFSFLGDVCLLSLPGQVQLKKILISHKVCTLLSKLIISMSFWTIYSIVTAVQGHSQGLYHPIPSNCRNVRCTRPCTGVKNKWGRRAFPFSSSLFLYDSWSFFTFACCWSTLYSHFCLYFTMTQKTFCDQKSLFLMLLQFLEGKSFEKIKIWSSRCLPGDVPAHCNS